MVRLRRHARMLNYFSVFSNLISSMIGHIIPECSQTELMPKWLLCSDEKVEMRILAAIFNQNKHTNPTDKAETALYKNNDQQ